MTFMTDSGKTSAPAVNPKKEKLIVFCVVGGIALLGIAFLVIGVVRIAPSRDTIQNARASTSWPRTGAKVTGARIEVIEGSVSTDTPTRHLPKVEYTYRVGEIDYTGDTIRFAELDFHRRGSRNRAQKVIDPYSNYPEVTAHYNPDAPSVSVLEPGVTLATFGALTDSLLWILFGTGILGFVGYLIWPRGETQEKGAVEKS